MGWAVDNYSRRWLLFFGVMFWSLAAMASSQATSFGSLALARAACGLGEAVLIPTAMSIIVSLFPRDRIIMATSAFYLAANVGGVIAVLFGGEVIQAAVAHGGMDLPIFKHFAPWQEVFFITGAPGVLMAFLVLTMPLNDKDRTSAALSTGWSAITLWQFLKTRRMFLITFIASVSAVTLCAYTLIAWGAAYYGRAYTWDHRTISYVLAAALAAGGIGNLVWGSLAAFLGRRGIRDAIYRVFIGLLIVTPLLSIPAFVFKVPMLSIPAFALATMVYMGFSALDAALQLVTPPHLLGRITALKLVGTIAVGLGLGPVIPGFLTDHLFHNRLMLGYSMAITIFSASFLAAACLTLGRRAFVAALEKQASQAETSNPVRELETDVRAIASDPIGAPSSTFANKSSGSILT
jgi:MFS family permease